MSKTCAHGWKYPKAYLREEQDAKAKLKPSEAGMSYTGDNQRFVEDALMGCLQLPRGNSSHS